MLYTFVKKSCRLSGNLQNCPCRKNLSTMSSPLVYMTCELDLTVKAVILLFKSPDVTKLSPIHPDDPSPGEVYLYTLRESQVFDNKQWVRTGRRKFPRKNPCFTKTYYREKNGFGQTQFLRHVFVNSKFVLVQYVHKSSTLLVTGSEKSKFLLFIYRYLHCS